MGGDVSVRAGFVRLLGLGRKDANRLQSVSQHNGVRSEQVAVDRGSQQRDAGHLGAMSVLIEAADADHGVQVLGCQGLLDEDVSSRYARVEVADGGLEFVGRFQSLGQVVDVLGLLLGGEVFYGVDELRAPDFGQRHRGER